MAPLGDNGTFKWVGPNGRKLGHWDCGLSSSLFYFPAISFLYHALPSMICCLITTPKAARSINLGLQNAKLWAKIKLSPFWLFWMFAIVMKSWLTHIWNMHVYIYTYCYKLKYTEIKISTMDTMSVGWEWVCENVGQRIKSGCCIGWTNLEFWCTAWGIVNTIILHQGILLNK
jgi:hypothetical protein